MSTASLSLLKNGNKATLAEELAKDDTVVVVDTQNMTPDELEKLVKDEGIDLPAAWGEYNHATKLQWLEDNFGTTDEPQESTESEVKVAHAAEIQDVHTALSPEHIDAALEKDQTVTGKTSVASPPTQQAPKKGKGKSKSKDVVISNTKEGEIIGPDVLQDLVHEIENMKEEQALAQIGQLTEQTEMTFFKLGGVLALVQTNDWYKPYSTFREWVEKEHGIGYHKATYFIQIYNSLVASKVPWEKVKGIGWTKMKEIARVLTADNVDDWVKIATEQNTINLIETVKNALKAKATPALEEQVAKTVVTKTFKLHEDQKVTIEAAIAKAKEATGTQFDTAALEFICIDFIGTMTLPQRLKAIGLEKAIKEFETAFPDASLSLEVGESEGS